MREALECELSAIDAPAALEVLQRLVEEYAQLQQLLDRKRGTDLVTLSPVSVLAEQTFRIGLGLLQDTLELLQTARPSERHRLQSKVLELSQQIEALPLRDVHDERKAILESTRRSHQDRLNIMDKQVLQVDQLLHLAGRCEASLHRTRMELAALNATDSERSVREATERLQNTIEQAKDIQEELKTLALS
jgi:hypothetical protein